MMIFMVMVVTVSTVHLERILDFQVKCMMVVMMVVVRMIKQNLPGILAKGTLKLQSCPLRSSRQGVVATPGFQLFAISVPLIFRDAINYISTTKNLPGLTDRYL